MPVVSRDEREAARLAAVVAEHRAGRRLTGGALRAAVVEALTYASEHDSVDRVRVHVVERYRGTLPDCQAVLASLTLPEWRAVTAERQAWQSAERVPAPVEAAGAVCDLGATAGGRSVLRRCGAYAPAEPVGRGRDARRVEALLDNACAHRAAGGSASAWVRWCADRGMSRAAAWRWWSRAA